MANEKQPRATTAKRTTTGSTTPRSKKNNPEVPTTEEPVSTAQATITTARNATIQGNATIDLDEVRRRAYELYEERGRTDGAHDDDWYVAEHEVRSRKQDSQSQNGSSRETKKRA
ncbi:MAG TPA: DUF2934 domain-containing protein [Terriglobales bacterium]|nr:DUF2934 domain-containing protein [Terriglobales bacterium]